MIDFYNLNFPSWATSNAACAFYAGMAFAVMVRLTRMGLRWLKRAADDNSGDYGD